MGDGSVHVGCHRELCVYGVGTLGSVRVRVVLLCVQTPGVLGLVLDKALLVWSVRRF